MQKRIDLQEHTYLRLVAVLDVLEEESFDDIPSLNFVLQTLPRKYDIKRTLLVVHDVVRNKVYLQTAVDENSYFVL
jgi:hypothetical protein